MPVALVRERLAPKLVMRAPDECWLWAGNTCKGYGTIMIHQKYYRVPRLMFYVTHGSFPDRARHTCDNTLCCNPNHIVDGSAKENTADMIQRGRAAFQNQTHCKHGHEYTEANTYRPPNGQRVCRTCQAAGRPGKPGRGIADLFF